MEFSAEIIVYHRLTPLPKGEVKGSPLGELAPQVTEGEKKKRLPSVTFSVVSIRVSSLPQSFASQNLSCCGTQCAPWQACLRYTLTTATRSGRFLCRRQCSPRSPSSEGGIKNGARGLILLPRWVVNWIGNHRSRQRTVPCLRAMGATEPSPVFQQFLIQKPNYHNFLQIHDHYNERYTYPALRA